MSNQPPIVMTIGASDPSGGTGVQADILTLASLGCHPVSILTALTVQDSVQMERLLPVEASWISAQARYILEDMPVSVFKVGFLGSVDSVLEIADILVDYPDIPLVIDPVFSYSTQEILAQEEIIENLLELIIPQTTIITTNTLEIHALVRDEERRLSIDTCIKILMEKGCQYVLVTGTHEHSQEVINTLYGENEILNKNILERLPGTYHGSGCTLAASIAGYIAYGDDIVAVVQQAQEYTWHTLRCSFRVGMGKYIPDRLFWTCDDEIPTDTEQ